ncbi:MAG: hypothetical protein A2Y72_03355 [Chloroflexi bacterium RBG_13_53_26]|nr:MAG: hypothetical protein A2Y72_03355 [Chloroflexi bacterium RBG_13_53_26]
MGMIDTKILMRLIGIVTDIGFSCRGTTTSEERHAAIAESMANAWGIIKGQLPGTLVEKALEAEWILVHGGGPGDEESALRALLGELKDIDAPQRLIALVNGIAKNIIRMEGSNG